MSGTIEVIVNATPPQPAGGGTKSILGSNVASATVSKSVDTGALKASLTRLTEGLGEMFGDLRAVGGMELDEVEVGIEITAEGGVKLIGTATVGATASVTLKFKRS